MYQHICRFNLSKLNDFGVCMSSCEFLKNKCCAIEILFYDD